MKPQPLSEPCKPRGKRRLLLRSLIALLAVFGAVMSTGTPAMAIGTGYWDPVTLNSNYAQWNASGCNGSTAYPFPGKYHTGRDYAADVGTQVKAIASGTVYGVYDFGTGFAKAMFVKHTAGDGSQFLALYGHVTAGKVAGEHVNAGDHIADVASIDGPSHLHFGIYPSWDNLPSSGWGMANCVSDGNGIGNSNGFVDPVAYLNAHPHDQPANTDPDGDGFSGNDDWCPNLWGKGHGCPIKADVSNDGKSDLLAFYRHDGWLTNLNQWNGQSNRYLSEPSLPWQGSGWGGQLMIPAGTGNVNGDNYQDVAAFYNHTGGMIDLNVWLGNSSGGLNQMNAWHMPTGSGWEGSRVKPVGMGDFNHDGRADIAAFYRYDNLNATLYVWRGQSNGTFAAPVDVWSASGWDVNLIKTVGIHDVDGDGNLDVATFYDHAGDTVDYNVWYSNGDMTFTLDRPWTTSGQGWDAANFMAPAITDLNSDGRGDAVVFYDHPGDGVQMRVWWGTSNRVSGAPGLLWESWGQGWEADRMMSAGVGDYDGDNHPDVATFYRHDGQVVDVNVWFGDGAGNASLFRSWDTMTGWEGGRIIPAGIG